MSGWMFGKKPKPRFQAAASATPPVSGRVEIRDEGRGWLSIPATGFYGVYAQSPNGRFRIAWRDGAGGDEGYYVLVYGEEIVLQGRMERPQDGKVADNGVFILNDWRSSSDLTGTFRAFRANGTQLIAQDFVANLFNNGLSADGRLAACQTCNSDDQDDSAVLTVFDLARGKELHRFRAESGWPDTYTFSPDGEILTLGYPNAEGEFAYKLDGTFVDRCAWVAAGLERGDLLMVRRVIDEAGGRPALDAARRLLEAVNRGLVHKNWQERGWQALGFRMRGELLEGIGELQPAVESYDKALTLNPKIGIKRRADQLRKLTSAKLASKHRGPDIYKDINMDNETRTKQGIVVSLLDQGDGRSRLLMDDVRSKGASTWMFDAFFTQKTFDNGCLDSMALTDDDYRDIGIAVVARLLALNGRTK